LVIKKGFRNVFVLRESALAVAQAFFRLLASEPSAKKIRNRR
jgi:hypothetical protein